MTIRATFRERLVDLSGRINRGIEVLEQSADVETEVRAVLKLARLPLRLTAPVVAAYLKLSGVDREILFSAERNVEPLRFHDMRGTFVTWARRQGRGEGWITDRTGHLTPEMVDRYDGGARVLADLRYEPFPDLTGAIPEFLEGKDNVVRLDVTAKRRLRK